MDCAWQGFRKLPLLGWHCLIVYNFYFSERRVIFDYDTIGDSPNCLGEIFDLAGQTGLTQGFGKTELEQEGAGKLLETNVTILSNQDCYEKLDNIISNDVNGYNLRASIKSAVYEGITDQLLCTEGLPVEKEICRGRGKRRKCFLRKFLSVYFFMLP